MPGARLCRREREEISRGVAENKSFAEIGRGLGRPTSTVSREVNRNGGRDVYRAWRAASDTAARCRRRRLRKLAVNRPLAEAVQAGLAKRWSPEQIACRLRMEHPDDPRWWVSHETIYQSLYVQGGGGLRRELIRALRSGRVRRYAHGEHRQGTGPNITGMVNISERPAEAEDRAVPGHWEGDLIIGARHKSQVGTLVERTSRFVMLIHLPGPKDAAALATGIGDKIVVAPAATPITDLGSGLGDGPPHRPHDRDWVARLLLRPALALATRQQREHQRPRAPIPTQEHRPHQRHRRAT